MPSITLEISDELMGQLRTVASEKSLSVEKVAHHCLQVGYGWVYGDEARKFEEFGERLKEAKESMEAKASELNERGTEIRRRVAETIKRVKQSQEEAAEG
jgi:hypothetical protein